MTEQSTELRPEVGAFVDRVRALMADLHPDERQELTAGLEADLAELVEEHGPERLGDPADYARELRLAAGHAPEMVRTTQSGRLRAAGIDALDGLHAHWDRTLDALPYGGPRGFLTSLQPVWWVARAWVAWMLVQEVFAGPSDFTLETQRVALLAVLVVVSVQLGRGSWGFGRLLAKSVLARLLLVGLNVLAVALVPGEWSNAQYAITENTLWVYCSDCGW